MSRLDSMLRRLAAQRDGLDWAAAQVAGQPGDALDIGLGNGRTYDHMREIMPGRRILVIDRALMCHPSCVPPPEDFLEGEAEPMLERLKGAGIRVAHYDLGYGVEADDIAEAARMSPLVRAVMAPGGIIVSGQPLVGFEELAGPESVPAERYRFYRV